MVSDVSCSNRTSEQRMKMSSLNWAIRRLSETRAKVMEVKRRGPGRGGGREKPNCSVLRREWLVGEQKRV